MWLRLKNLKNMGNKNQPKERDKAKENPSEKDKLPNKGPSQPNPKERNR